MEPHSKGTATEAMQAKFDLLRKQLVDMKEQLGSLTENSIDAEKVSTFGDGLFCLELAMTFYEQANAALQAEAWFAASAVASSALESLLMSKCCFQEEDVRLLPAFQTLKPSQRSPFGRFVRSLDLGKLLKIADALRWFPEAGVSPSLISYLAPYLGQTVLSEFLQLFRYYDNVGQSCADRVREYRNLLHPAVCLKEGRQPSEGTGMIATMLFLVAFSSLSNI